MFPRRKARLDLRERRVLAQRVQGGHKWVALLPTFCLMHRVNFTLVVIPKVLGGLAVKLAHERQRRGCPRKATKPLQHGLSADEVEGADAIYGEDGCCGTCLRETLQHMGYTLRACPGRKGILKRGACFLEL